MHRPSKTQAVEEETVLTQVKQVEVSTQTSSIFRSMVKAAQVEAQARAEGQARAEELVPMAHMVSEEVLEEESAAAQAVEDAKVQEVLAPRVVGKHKKTENSAESRESDTLEMRRILRALTHG